MLRLKRRYHSRRTKALFAWTLFLSLMLLVVDEAGVLHLSLVAVVLLSLGFLGASARRDARVAPPREGARPS